MWVELFRTRHYDGAYSWVRGYTGERYGWHNFEEVESDACGAYMSLDGRFRVTADVVRHNSVRIVEEWHDVL